MKGLAAANYIWSQRILAAVNSNSKRKAWIAIAIALVGALVAFWMPGEPKKTPPGVPEPAKAKRAATADTRASFDFYLMALTVHAAFCDDGHARTPECRVAVRRPLVIHGLWPERNEPRTYPHDCPAASLDLDPALALELADFMPGMADGLHEHEWREHGGCSGLDDDEYFRQALELARGVDAALGARLTTLAGQETTGAELRGIADLFHPGLGATLTFHCRVLRDANSAQPHLIEIRQCVDNDGPNGAPHTPLDCAAVKRRDQGCGQHFRIAGNRR
jgi:ribonuclease I